MKINEFNKPKQVDEGLGDAFGAASRALVGDYATSAVKGMFTGKGTAKQLEYDLFFKDFYNDAVTSLQNGISGGIVDPSLEMEEPGAPKEKEEPAAGTVDTSTKTPPAAPTATKTAPISTPASTPASTAPAAPAAPASRGKAGPTSAQATVAAAKQFNKGVTAAQSANADKRKANDELKASAQAAMAKPAFQQTATDRVAIQKARQAGLVKEDAHYAKLNALFESIMEVTSGGMSFGAPTMPSATVRKATPTASPQDIKTPQNVALTAPTLNQKPAAKTPSNAKSIGEYMLDWFTAYMGGTNWTSYKPRVIELIKNIENTYGSDKGKTAIKTLAKAAYAIPGASGAKGAQNAKGPEEPAAKKGVTDFGAKTQSAEAPADMSDEQFANFLKNNPDKADAIIKNLRAAK